MQHNINIYKQYAHMQTYRTIYKNIQTCKHIQTHMDEHTNICKTIEHNTKHMQTHANNIDTYINPIQTYAKLQKRFTKLYKK